MGNTKTKLEEPRFRKIYTPSQEITRAKLILHNIKNCSIIFTEEDKLNIRNWACNVLDMDEVDIQYNISEMLAAQPEEIDDFVEGSVFYTRVLNKKTNNSYFF